MLDTAVFKIWFMIFIFFTKSKTYIIFYKISSPSTWYNIAVVTISCHRAWRKMCSVALSCWLGGINSFPPGGEGGVLIKEGSADHTDIFMSPPVLICWLLAYSLVCWYAQAANAKLVSLFFRWFLKGSKKLQKFGIFFDSGRIGKIPKFVQFSFCNLSH